MKMQKNIHRGDTIIELILAIAIFSLAAVMTLAVLHQGVAMSQRSLETTLVRQQIDTQAELIRYLQESNNPVWANDIVSKATTTVAPLNSDTCPANAGGSLNGFYVVNTGPDAFSVVPAQGAEFAQAETHARIDAAAKKSYGIWVQIAKAENATADAALNAYDMYIHACWRAPGQARPMTLGTIVRLYAR